MKACTYHSAAIPATTGMIPWEMVGTTRGAGRARRPPAASGPRKRISSSVSKVAVPRRSSAVNRAEERSVRRSGRSAEMIPPPSGSGVPVRVSRATITCPMNGTSAKAPSPRNPGTSAIPESAATRRITGVSVFWASLPLFDAVVTARQVAAASAARPTNAITVTAAPAPSAGSCTAGRKRRPTAPVRAIERQLAASVARVTA